MAKGTVLVNLKKDWFAPDASLYQAADNPHEFPADYAAKPAQREGEKDEQFEARKDAPFNVLPSTAELLGDDFTTVATIQYGSGNQRILTATAVEGDVASVGNALDDKGVEKGNLSTAAAEKGAKAHDVEVGGKPRESGPLPAGTKKPA